MKKKYIIPITELVAINLQDSLLEETPIGDPSHVATGMTNEISIDIEDDVNGLPTSKSLWD